MTTYEKISRLCAKDAEIRAQIQALLHADVKRLERRITGKYVKLTLPRGCVVIALVHGRRKAKADAIAASGAIVGVGVTSFGEFTLDHYLDIKNYKCQVITKEQYQTEISRLVTSCWNKVGHVNSGA